MGSAHGLLLLSCSSLLLAFSLSFLLPARLAGAAEYTVGDGINSWDTGTNFATWAEKYNFAVGDVLVFQYVKTQHDVYEVTESTYRSCNASSGVLHMYTSGYDKVELKEAKNYWFICNVPGHCLGGMRLDINVTAAPAADSGGGPRPDVPTPMSAYGNAARAAGDGWSWWMLGLAFGVLGLINCGRHW